MDNSIRMTNHLLSGELQDEWQRIHAAKRERGIGQRFNQDKFAMFIHWGLYSIPSGRWKGRDVWGMGEWIMWHGNIPQPDSA